MNWLGETKFGFGVTMGENKGYQHPTDVAFSQDNPTMGWVGVLSHQDKSRNYKVTLGGLIEKDGILGSRSGGNFGLASEAITSFVGLSVHQYLGTDYSIEAGAKAGHNQSKDFSKIHCLRVLIKSLQVNGDYPLIVRITLPTREVSP